ncbi:hypothetical protein [Hansschlegelia sp. KR7-227]|uniref:hypothetical protein n=1 Tax=Hansschlegelia sp. KR7-227 TaxID=3400914 RepID=UPI003C07A250
MSDPTYRKFDDKPDPGFSQKVRDHVAQTGRPETMAELYHGAISPDERFRIVCEITVNQRKRPEADKAPCPMCTPNRFLKGRLCWFPEKRFAAVIGHCCASRENSAEAERIYKHEQLEIADHNYLLTVLPAVPRMLAAIEELKITAVEARRLHRQFASKGGEVQRILRAVGKDVGRLVVPEVIERKFGSGPAGFRGTSGVQTRDVSFGYLRGLTVLQSKFDPVAKLERLERELRLLDCGDTDDATLTFVIGLEEADRRRAVIWLKEADKEFMEIMKSLGDVEAFFAPRNIDAIRRWSLHRDNMHTITVVDHDADDGRREIMFIGKTSRVRLQPGPELAGHHVEWPKAA